MRMQLQEIGMAVLTFVDAHVMQYVREAEFFQRDGDLEAVGRAVGVQVQRNGGHSGLLGRRNSGRGSRSRAGSMQLD